MKITWLGHASFLVESRDGTRLLTDPFEAGSYDGAVGYRPIAAEADVVTVSHEHADHNAVDAVKGSPEVVREAGGMTVKGIPITGVNTYHDESKGWMVVCYADHPEDPDKVRVLRRRLTWYPWVEDDAPTNAEDLPPLNEKASFH